MEAEREDAEEELKTQKVEARDLLHLGNYDAYLLNDMTQARSDYNDQLIKYNSKFSQLVGKLHSNQQQIDQIFSELPQTDGLLTLQEKISTFKGLQKTFNDHYVVIDLNLR